VLLDRRRLCPSFFFNLSLIITLKELLLVFSTSLELSQSFSFIRSDESLSYLFLPSLVSDRTKLLFRLNPDRLLRSLETSNTGPAPPICVSTTYSKITYKSFITPSSISVIYVITSLLCSH
jgi:hypothetical protein